MTALVHIVDDVPELDGSDELTLVLVPLRLPRRRQRRRRGLRPPRSGLPTALRAGKVVATFDVDQFHDYRARRPAMSFVRDHYEQYDAPRLLVRAAPRLRRHAVPAAARTRAGQPLGGVLRRVRERSSSGSASPAWSASAPCRWPSRTPDRSPSRRTPQRRAPHRRSPWRGELRIPSSAQSLLELRLGDWGHDALGFVAHVPHYLAQLDYPPAAIALLEAVELGGRLTVDLSALREEGDERELEISRYLAGNSEVSEVVTALEQQYDTFRAPRRAGSSLLAEDQPLPTGEEIGRQFEQFLAGLDGQTADRQLDDS